MTLFRVDPGRTLVNKERIAVLLVRGTSAMYASTGKNIRLRALCGTLLAASLLAVSVPLTAPAMGLAAPPSVLPTAQLAAAVTPVIAMALPSKVRTTANLNMRSGASTAYRILLTIPSGTTVPVSGQASNGWYKVSYAERTGWVSNAYVTTNTSTPAAPSAPRTTGPNRTSRVVLTFDDCPRTLSAFTAATKYAAANNIGLVLAPTGDCLRSFRARYGVDIAALARAKGQWVINHSISHPDLRPLSCVAVASQLGGSGVRTNYGRPPYGAVDGSVVCGYNRVGMAIWTWSRDTLDWSVKSKSITVARASAARPGDTVLMHMQWYGFAPDSLRQINANLAKRGVKLCRAYHGTDGVGAVATTPIRLPSSLPC